MDLRIILLFMILFHMVNAIRFKQCDHYHRSSKEKCPPKKVLYKKIPVYRIERYPVEVPVRVPVYIKVKKPYQAIRSIYGRGLTGVSNLYDHEYHADNNKIRGNQGRRFGPLGFGEQYPDYTGLGRFNQNRYDDSKKAKA